MPPTYYLFNEICFHFHRCVTTCIFPPTLSVILIFWHLNRFIGYYFHRANFGLLDLSVLTICRGMWQTDTAHHFIMLSWRKVPVLENPQGPIYKSSALSSDIKSLDHKVLENCQGLHSANCPLCKSKSVSKPIFIVTQCCCPWAKSLSSRILEDQFTSPCHCPWT